MTLLDQLGPATAKERLGAPIGSVFLTLLSPQPLFHPLSYPCIVFLILSVNPAPRLFSFLRLSHYSNRIARLSLLTASQKQGQSCNPLTATLSTDFAQIILKDSQPRLGALKGTGVKKKSECERRGEARREPWKKSEEGEQHNSNRRKGTCVTVI